MFRTNIQKFICSASIISSIFLIDKLYYIFYDIILAVYLSLGNWMNSYNLDKYISLIHTSKEYMIYDVLKLIIIFMIFIKCKNIKPIIEKILTNTHVYYFVLYSIITPILNALIYNIRNIPSSAHLLTSKEYGFMSSITIGGLFESVTTNSNLSFQSSILSHVIFIIIFILLTVNKNSSVIKYIKQLAYCNTIQILMVLGVLSNSHVIDRQFYSTITFILVMVIIIPTLFKYFPVRKSLDKCIKSHNTELLIRCLLIWSILFIPYHVTVEVINDVNIVQALYNSLGGFIVIDILYGNTVLLMPWYSSTDFITPLAPILLFNNIPLAIDNLLILALNLVIILVVYITPKLKEVLNKTISNLYVKYIVLYSILSALVVDAISYGIIDPILAYRDIIIITMVNLLEWVE